MTIQSNRQLVAELESTRRYEVTEMHLFDEDEVEEEVLCGADTLADNRRSVMFYLEDRLHGADVGTICEGCKVPAPRFAMKLAQDMETEGFVDEAEDYRGLAQTLLEETCGNARGG